MPLSRRSLKVYRKPDFDVAPGNDNKEKKDYEYSGENRQRPADTYAFHNASLLSMPEFFGGMVTAGKLYVGLSVGMGKRVNSFDNNG